VSVAEFTYTVLLKPKPLRAAANSLLRAMVPTEVHVGSATVVLNPRDPVISGALALGVYEKAETKVFQTLCRPGMSFVDIGANVGYYTAQAMQVLGTAGSIVALEPEPESYRYLQQTIAANLCASSPTLRPVNAAAGARAGHAQLHTNSDNRGDNRLYANALADGACEVDVVAVDDLLAQLGVREVHLVKIDVQGYEGQVLAGMRHTLERATDLAMMFEFWPEGLQRAGSDASEIVASLAAMGYKLYEITPRGDLEPLDDPRALIARHTGRRYTNLVARKGAHA
jgi:FkbM family methyltransferase